jgi:FHA domain
MAIHDRLGILDILGILDRARKLESRVARALTRAAEDAVGTGAREPLEIAHAIVDAVERQVQPAGRGAHLFPFNSIAVSVLAPSRDSRARLDALFAATPSLRDRIVDRLRSAGCDARDLRLELAYVGRAARSWDNPHFHVAFDRVAVAEAAPAPVDSMPARIEVTVVRGVAERRTYSFNTSRIDLGRGVEVRDDRHRLLRTNHVVFVEGSAAVNQTVSRRHAHIAVDSSGDHRLRDDRSEHGTGIVRGGRTIPVPAGSRGVRLRSGDEIALGEARVRIRIEPAVRAG